jgi:hypothetical protein
MVSKNRRPAAIAFMVASLTCLGLGACGSSSSGSSSSTSTPTAAHTTAEAPPTTPASTTPASTAPASTAPTKTEPTITSSKQFADILECMRRNGIKLPPLKDLSKINPNTINTNTPQYKSALAKCRHEVLG